MAPALTVTPREPPLDVDAVAETDKPLSHRRRALASVDNLSIHMEEDEMGLQNQPNLAKDSQEMEQLLVDLNNSDPADLLQAFKTLETGGDGLSTGDADTIFPLSGFDLADTVDSEGDAAEDKLKSVQIRLERRCAVLQRRLRILQARSLGKRIAEEAAQTFDKCTRGARKDGGGRPVGLKALLKRIETTAALQASAASRSVVGPKYYRAGTSKGDASRSASVGIASGTLTGLEDTAGALRSHLSVVKHELDSDATASSSGAESNDEAVTYNNPHQQPMPIEKRALWSWQRTRASIASRWCWLQAQVQELEYKIRQHNELHKQVREAKGPVELVGEPVGFEGSLPGAEELADDDPATETCARVRPLRRETFKKRKLLQMHNLHIATNKAAKPSDVKCSCEPSTESCAVCTGRAECSQPAPPLCTLAPAHRVALVDPAFHPVLSDTRDISHAVHMSALCSRSWFRPRHSRAPRSLHGGGRHAHAHTHAHTHGHSSQGHGSHSSPSTPHDRPARSNRRHPTRLKRGRPPLSRRLKEREREERADESSTSGQDGRPRGRPSTETRTRRQSYDIDNIVIPQSVAANTRVQILTYKEIVTPKWRVLEIPEVPLNNGVARSTHRMSVESEEEDISESAIEQRHTAAEGRERSRYLRKQRPRRSHHDPAPAPASTPATTPASTPASTPAPAQVQAQRDEAPELPPPLMQPPVLLQHETVRPYSPRQFPLQEDTYLDMLSAMPHGYRPSSPEPSPPPPDEDVSSTLSPVSPICPFEGDDPDDAEWDPSAEIV